jgi:hypothetical protein
MHLISDVKDGLRVLYASCHPFLMRFTFLSTLALWLSTILVSSGIVDQYVATESSIAKTGLLANIGPNGSKCAGAKVLLHNHPIQSLIAHRFFRLVSLSHPRIQSTPITCILGYEMRPWFSRPSRTSTPTVKILPSALLSTTSFPPKPLSSKSPILVALSPQED